LPENGGGFYSYPMKRLSTDTDSSNSTAPYSMATSWESSDGNSNPTTFSDVSPSSFTVCDSTRPQDAVNPYDSAASSDFYTFMQDNAAKETQGVPANIAALYSVPIKRSMPASHQAQLHFSAAATPPDPLDLTNNGSYQTLL
jgi:hypothetical protein